MTGGNITCGVCKTVYLDERLKPAHHGGRTEVHCEKCNKITCHIVTHHSHDHQRNLGSDTTAGRSDT